MAQQGNSDRNAQLDDKKRREVGRAEENPLRADPEGSITDAPAKGQTGGAHGKNDHAHRNQAPQGSGGGGGGGLNSPAKDAAINTPPSGKTH